MLGLKHYLLYVQSKCQDWLGLGLGMVRLVGGEEQSLAQDTQGRDEQGATDVL